MKCHYPENMSVSFLKKAVTDTVFLLSSLRDSNSPYKGIWFGIFYVI